MPQRLGPFSVSIAAALLAAATGRAQEAGLPPSTVAALTKFCADCHSGKTAEARVDLAQLAAAADFSRGFKDWEKVIRMLRQGKMPPQDAPQPSATERMAIAASVEQSLDRYIAAHAGDPGPVLLR